MAKSTDFCIRNSIGNKIESPKGQNNEKKKKDKKDGNNNFWNFILYKLSLDKNNTTFEIYQNFRIKIISEEHLIRNHLQVYNLMRVTERKRSHLKSSYQLKDLIRLV